jgi:hypothetical protein
MWRAWERGETCTGFWWETRKEKDHSKDQGVDAMMGIKTGWRGVEWIYLAQDRDRWRAVANAVMNLRVKTPQSYDGLGLNIISFLLFLRLQNK